MENIAHNSTIYNQHTENVSGERTVYRVKNERMAGSLPSWDMPKQMEEQTFDNVLSSYRTLPEPVDFGPVAQTEEFSFWDFIDMVNPLQHIPLVNLAYRGLSGDEIKPASKIIGGGIFGGPAGAASGLVNAVIEEETGRDMLGNATSFVGLGKREAYKYDKEYAAYEDLPMALLSFAEMPVDYAIKADNNEQPQNRYQRVQVAQGRTAGTFIV